MQDRKLPRDPTEPPTSRHINTAIEVLRNAGVDPDTIAELDKWNAARLVDAARAAPTDEELRYLFAGLGNRALSRNGPTGSK